MTTARTFCTRALRRLGVVGRVETPSAEDAALALACLNELLRGWQSRGMNMLIDSDMTLDSDVVYFIPPLDMTSDVIDVLSYRGTWDASANSPALASSTGTTGYAYKVATAGSATLDDVTSWSVGDYAVFDGTEWLKGLSVERLTGAILSQLVMRLVDEYGMQVSAKLASDAADSWYTLQSYYVKAPVATFDSALINLPSRTMTNTYDEL